MKEGAVALARMQQADGQLKLRPVLVLRLMPPMAIGWFAESVRSCIRRLLVLIMSSPSVTPISHCRV